MKALRAPPPLAAAPVAAGPAHVVGVTAPGGFRLDVTVSPADEGWQRCADALRVLAPGGAARGLSTALRPPIDARPLARRLVVDGPDGAREVRVEARDSRLGWGGAAVTEAPPGR